MGDENIINMLNTTNLTDLLTTTAEAYRILMRIFTETARKLLASQENIS